MEQKPNQSTAKSLKRTVIR